MGMNLHFRFGNSDKNLSHIISTNMRFHDGFRQKCTETKYCIRYDRCENADIPADYVSYTYECKGNILLNNSGLYEIYDVLEHNI